MPPENAEAREAEKLQNIAATKQLRKELDDTLQNLKKGQLARHTRERSLCMTKIQEAIMWLGMDLKDLNDGVSCYPKSYDPSSPVVEPVPDGIKF